MPTLTNENDTYVLHLGSDANEFTQAWLSELEESLNTVVTTPAPLITIAEGKSYSNGLDLEWMNANPGEMSAYVGRVQALFARVLTLPVPTVAAISGHAFGAGAMLAMAHDWRVMRDDRGYLCFPEIDIRIPFTSGMAALIQSKLTPRAALDAMSTGYRYGGQEALDAGLVDSVAAESDLLETARERVAGLTDKHPGTLGAIKSMMYAQVVIRLNEPIDV